MNNKDELEKYKKELADMEAKDKQENENDKFLDNNAKQENNALDEMDDGYFQRPHMQKLYRIIMRLFVVVFGLVLLQAFIPIPFIAFLFNPASYNFPLPYNGIDFKKISYINNQFIMYGVDYDEPKEPKLAIFNSVDGKKWTRSQVTYHGKKDNIPVNFNGTFSYFNGHCYLFGATGDPLIADGDCHEWHDNQVKALKNEDLVLDKINDSNPKRQNYLMQVESYRQTNYLTTAHDSTLTKDSIYIATEHGLYSSQDGVSWANESPPCLKEWGNSDCKMKNASFGSITYGNNKVLVSYPSKSLIYTKDLSTNQWSYESFSSAITSLVYGKDKFVGLSSNKAWVLTNNHWESSLIKTNSSELIYGLNDKFIGINPVLISLDGKSWEMLRTNFDDGSPYISLECGGEVCASGGLGKLNPISLTCNKDVCITVGYKYKIGFSYDATNWELEKFEYENHKLAWYRRFFK